MKANNPVHKIRLRWPSLDRNVQWRRRKCCNDVSTALLQRCIWQLSTNFVWLCKTNVKAPTSRPSAVWITLTHFATERVFIFSGTNYCHVTIRTWQTSYSV